MHWLGCAGLGWTGTGCAGPGWAVQGWAGLVWALLGWARGRRDGTDCDGDLFRPPPKGTGDGGGGGGGGEHNFRFHNSLFRLFRLEGRTRAGRPKLAFVGATIS